MSIHFNAFTQQDYPELLRLTEQIWTDTYSEILSPQQMTYMIEKMYSLSKINEQLDNNDIWELMRNENNELMGYLHYYKKEEILWLSKIYLSKTYWHQNLSPILINRVTDYASEHQINTIQLTVNKQNIRAQKFYIKMGFENIEEKIFDIGQGYVMDDYIFSKKINDTSVNR